MTLVIMITMPIAYGDFDNHGDHMLTMQTEKNMKWIKMGENG